MKVHEVMSAPPHTCRAGTDLATASRRMKQTATGMLVVLDGHGRIAGVVTDRDLALAIGANRGDVRDRFVREVMSRRVRSCQEQDDVHEALAIMTRAHIRRLPVLSVDGDLKGVVSVDDLILWAVRHSALSPTEMIGALRRICRPTPAEEDPSMPRF
jgi:CBS domain-containing protein